MPIKPPGRPLPAALDLNTTPFGDTRREGSGLSPDDPARYEFLMAHADAPDVALWAHNFRRLTGRPLRIPVGLYDTLKAKGCTMKDLEPMKPNMY